MVERVAGITRVQPVNYYDADRQSRGDTMKKKQELDFKRVLDRHIKGNKENMPEAYAVDFHTMPR